MNWVISIAVGLVIYWLLAYDGRDGEPGCITELIFIGSGLSLILLLLDLFGGK